MWGIIGYVVYVVATIISIALGLGAWGKIVKALSSPPEDGSKNCIRVRRGLATRLCYMVTWSHSYEGQGIEMADKGTGRVTVTFQEEVGAKARKYFAAKLWYFRYLHVRWLGVVDPKELAEMGMGRASVGDEGEIGAKAKGGLVRKVLFVGIWRRTHEDQDIEMADMGMGPAAVGSQGEHKIANVQEGFFTTMWHLGLWRGFP